MADHLMVWWSDCMLVQWSEGRMSEWSGGLKFRWVCNLMDQWSGGLMADALTVWQPSGLVFWLMVTSSDGLHDCHGNTALAASIHTISHAGSPQCTYSFSHNSYFTFLHAFIFLCFISIGPLVHFCYCHLHVPVYLSLFFCCSFHLPLFLLASLSVPFNASFFPYNIFFAVFFLLLL